MENKTVIHSFWIAGALQKINHLTIKSFLDKGHEFKLYAYNVLPIRFNCPELVLNTPGFSLHDASEILPESEIYYYKKMLGGNPNFKFGGIAERLKAEMLYQLGGWHVDLDVTCLHNFNTIINHLPLDAWRFEKHGEPNEIGMQGESAYPPQYFLRPHEKGVVGNIIKAPKHSELARRYVEHTKTIDENNTHWEKSFMGLNQIVKDLALEKYILPKEILGDDSGEYWEKFLKAGNKPEPELHAIHWCNAMQRAYEKGSYLDELFYKYNLQ